MNLVNKEYHKRARVLLEHWQDKEASSTPFISPGDESLASLLELSLLTADASISEVNKLCKTARDYALAGICVTPTHVQRCVEILGQELPTGTVVGFPLGANHPDIKVAEAQLAVSHGARRLNLVLNVGLLKTSNFQEVFEELRAVRYACPEADLTVILETGMLEPLQIIIACMLCREAGVDDVMTSTGYSATGATPENVSLIRSVLGNDLGVQASGGINDRDRLLDLLRAGATRLSLDFSALNDTLSGLPRRADRPVDE